MPNVAEIIKDHVTLEVRCLDRLYLNAYVPRLQSGGGVIDFLVRACGQKIASPAIFGQITTPFRTALRAWAGRHHIPWVEFRTRLEIWPAAGHGRAQRALPFPLDRRRAANAQLRPLVASLLGTSYTTR